MLEGLTTFFKRIFKSDRNTSESSKDAAKERLHLVLMQDRANVSADFLDLMKQEIIDVIKKYIVVDEKEIDVRLTNQSNEDGTNGAPALYANIPILNIKNDVKGEKMRESSPVVEIKEKTDETKNEANEDKKETETIEEKDNKVDEEQKSNAVESEKEEVSKEKETVEDISNEENNENIESSEN